MNHSQARTALVEALKALGIMPTRSVAQHVQGVAYLESRYGTAWSTPEGRASNNWGAVQYRTPGQLGLDPTNDLAPHPSHLTSGAVLPYPRISPDGKGFLAVDSSPGKGWYWIYFRRYGTPAEGAAHVAKVMYVARPSVLSAAKAGNTYGVSEQMRNTVYYEGFGKTRSDQIANHYKSLSAIIQSIARDLDEPMPGGETPLPATIKMGDRGATVKTWQRVLVDAGFALVVDGVFGTTTEKHTIAWQEFNNAEPDGVVGPVTWQRAIGETTEPTERVNSLEGRVLRLAETLEARVQSLEVRVDRLETEDGC